MKLDNLYWIMGILQNMANGLVVVDREYRVHMWNKFMENHSGIALEAITDANLFTAVPNLEEQWFKQKIDSAFLLDSPGYTIWEERPHIFKFETARPITGHIKYMYQNSTLMPLKAVDAEVSHVAILINDVTAIAVNKMGLIKANQKLANRVNQAGSA
ncbi:MAG: hypothetical protein KUG79_02755 [Pseudomonadales bacterium]|nr:hypothetical protein [Pseudomonadales bacterium]